MKILNLYACLGGNRYLWEDNHDITAVELDADLARLYKERFPNDNVIVTDAHQFLVEHYKEYDFIWSSPPCPTHSRARFWNSSNDDTLTQPVYPDMTLYQEIIFLEHFFMGLYCVENVIPYYKPLIQAKKRGRHLYWTNFNLPPTLSERVVHLSTGDDEVRKLCAFHDVDINRYIGNQRKDKIVRNMVDYVAGKTILDAALGTYNPNKNGQCKFF